MNYGALPDHHTGIYVDDQLVAKFFGNNYAEEQEAIARYRRQGKIFFERLIGGNGKVALRFRARR